LVKEVRLIAEIKIEAFRHWATQYHNSTEKNKHFKMGDIVFKKTKGNKEY
jgi:hypothetical protein